MSSVWSWISFSDTVRRHLLPFLLCLAINALPCYGDIVVAVRSDSEIGSLSRNEVVNIFLGRWRQLPSGQQARPLDQPMQSAERQTFYQSLINKSVAEINAYWARLLFTGRVSPPATVDSTEQAVDELLRNPNAIAYFERNRLDRRLRVVFEPQAP